MPPGGQWLSRHCALPANPAPSTSPSNSNLMFPSVFPHCGPLIAWRALTEKMYWYQDFFSLLDRKSTRLNSSHGYISYAVFCLKKKQKYRLHDKEYYHSLVEYPL